MPSTLAWRLGSCCAVLWLLLTVRYGESLCGDPTLDWVLIEPMARALGVHAWFRWSGPLSALVPLAPLAGALLGLLTLGVALSSRRGGAQGERATALQRLIVAGVATGLLLSMGWTGLLVLTVHF